MRRTGKRASAATGVTFLAIPACVCVCFTPQTSCFFQEQRTAAQARRSLLQIGLDPISHRNINNKLFSSTLEDISGMSAGEIRQELQSYGIDSRIYLEKSELVTALRMARYERQTFSADDAEPAVRTGSTGPSNSTPSSSPTSRKEEIQRKMEQYKSLSVVELKSRLEGIGVSTKAFFEKSDFERALAEEDAYDPEVRDVTVTKFRFDPFDKQFKDVLIDIGKDGKAAAPPPKDRYGRYDFGYNGYGKDVDGYGQYESWDGSNYQGTSDDQKRWKRTDAAKGSTWAGSAWDRSGRTGSSATGGDASPPPPRPPPPPPDEYQKRYEAGSSKRRSDGQVPFTERVGRSGNGVDSGWWDQPRRS